MADPDGVDATVHSALARLGTDPFLLQGKGIETELERLRGTTGVDSVTPWRDGAPGAYEAAAAALPAVRTALTELESAERRLPALEAHYRELRKRSSGPVVLLGFLALIALTVLVGQVF